MTVSVPIPKEVPIHWKIAGTLFRSIFLVAIAIITAWISLPDSLSAAALAHFSAADFVRAAVGVAICAFMAIELFRRPKDDHGYKAWVYIGLALMAVSVFVAAIKVGFPPLI
jgi:hypothetical protein